jgi:ATP-dependent helicase HrpA
VRAFPALADAGNAVDIRLFDTQAQADEAMWRGNRRLLLIAVPSGAGGVAKRLPGRVKLAMSRHPYASTAALLDDCATCAADQVIADFGGPAWDAAAFARLLEKARLELPAGTARVVSDVAQALTAAQEAASGLDAAASSVLAPAVADIRGQFAALVYPGFVSETGAARLPDLARYLRAISQRLAKVPQSPGRDAERTATVHRVTGALQQRLAGLPPGSSGRPDVKAVRWMTEELRVSLFAQTLGARGPVSERRVMTAIDRL